MNLSLDPFSGAGEHYDLDDALARLKAMPDIQGGWVNPASLRRLGYEKMPLKMYRRFVKKIELVDLGHAGGRFGPCWIWQNSTHEKGYGRFYLGETDEGGRLWAQAHRIAFEHWIDFPKPGYIVDHQCNNKLCCNPLHVWPETVKENLRLAEIRRPYRRRNQYSVE